MTKRKDFEKRFLPFNENGTQIWVVSKIKELPPPIVAMAVKLARLHFIRYIRITDDTLAASSENRPKSPKIPVTDVGHTTAIGIQILYNKKYKSVDFFDINSPVKGKGSQMAGAILDSLPKTWRPSVFMDWSNGFWDKIKKRYPHHTWRP